MADDDGQPMDLVHHHSPRAIVVGEDVRASEMMNEESLDVVDVDGVGESLDEIEVSLDDDDGGDDESFNDDDEAVDSPLNHAHTREIHIEEGLSLIGFGMFQWKLITLCGLLWATEGMEIMLLALSLPILREEWDMSAWESASMVSTVFFGYFLGAPVWGFVSDRWGRRVAYLTSMVIALVGAISSVFVTNWPSLALARCIGGAGSAGGHVAFSLFAEYLPSASRGAPLVYFELYWSVGIIGQSLMAWVVIPNLGWRWFFALSAVPMAVVLALSIPLIPESARYHLIKGQPRKALYIFRHAAIENGCGDAIPANVRLASPPAASSGTSLVQTLAMMARHYWWTIGMLSFLWVAVNEGYYGISLLLPQYYQELGLEDPYVGIIVTTISEIPGAIGAALLIDRLGRKHTLASFFLLSGCFTLLLVLPSENVYIAICFNVLARGFNFGAFAVVWVFTPELFPTVVRGKALGLFLFLSKIGGTTAPFISLLLAEKDLRYATGAFGTLSVAAAIATWAIRHETLGSGLKDTLDELSTDAPKSKAVDVEAVEMSEPSTWQAEAPSDTSIGRQHGRP